MVFKDHNQDVLLSWGNSPNILRIKAFNLCEKFLTKLKI